MKSMHDGFSEYQNLVQTGDIARVYKGMQSLRRHLRDKHREYKMGSFNQGTMDFTYFSLSTKELKAEQLKLVIIFNHQKASFEIWLAGQNKQVQKQYLVTTKMEQSVKVFLQDLSKNGDQQKERPL